jgi:hypothetical protein
MRPTDRHYGTCFFSFCYKRDLPIDYLVLLAMLHFRYNITRYHVQWFALDARRYWKKNCRHVPCSMTHDSLVTCWPVHLILGKEQVQYFMCYKTGFVSFGLQKKFFNGKSCFENIYQLVSRSHVIITWYPLPISLTSAQSALSVHQSIVLCP